MLIVDVAWSVGETVGFFAKIDRVNSDRSTGAWRSDGNASREWVNWWATKPDGTHADGK